MAVMLALITNVLVAWGLLIRYQRWAGPSSSANLSVFVHDGAQGPVLVSILGGVGVHVRSITYLTPARLLPADPAEHSAFKKKTLQENEAFFGKSDPKAMSRWPLPQSNEFVEQTACGWPWHSFSGAWDGRRVDKSENAIGTPWRLPLGERVYLPYLPFWSGMAGNVGVFAAVWFVLITGLGMLRSMWAVKAGCCRRCRYDLKGLAPEADCPECGAKRGSAVV